MMCGIFSNSVKIIGKQPISLAKICSDDMFKSFQIRNDCLGPIKRREANV